MGLEIHSTMAQIGINRIPATLSLEQPSGELSIEQVPAQMTVNHEPPRVVIDQSRCFAEAGLKGFDQLNQEYAQAGRQAFLEFTGRTAEQGDQLGDLRIKVPARTLIAQIAQENATAGRQGELTLVTMPSSRPKIDVTGYLDINWELGKAVVSYQPRNPVAQYQAGKVEISMKQWNSLEIRYVDERV